MWEEHRAQIRGHLVEDEDGAKLSDHSPWHACPQRRGAPLLDYDGTRLFHVAVLHALDVPLHAGLEGVRWVADDGADWPADECGCHAGSVVGLADAVRELHLDLLSDDWHQTEEACAIETLTQANAEGSSRDHGGAALQQVLGDVYEAATLSLLLDHG
eukprot:CAMPEP_0115152072 /NCGR_PEP_ID=MMETSP0227-20121206/65959_1 /TAXON_ID=89957 /ORGANISM="Polarella glacialis, Strain CCMP 1383" /LENGTH=157 /DNA_ID=CAMNT_0002562643 /DNA_START=308 /DNA_END=781 /DNA_ORIENTATION=-